MRDDNLPISDLDGGRALRTSRSACSQRPMRTYSSQAPAASGIPPEAFLELISVSLRYNSSAGTRQHQTERIISCRYGTTNSCVLRRTVENRESCSSTRTLKAALVRQGAYAVWEYRQLRAGGCFTDFQHATSVSSDLSLLNRREHCLC